MKRVVFLFSIITLLSSCAAYQINTVSSTNTPKIDSTGIFMVETDSVTISYNFTGANAPVNVEVFNKLNEPLIINWERSALIVADKAYSYVDDNLKITGEVAGSSLNFRNSDITYSSSDINANVKLSKNESFLPPHSKAGRTIYVLNQIGINKIEKSSFKRLIQDDADGMNKIYTKTADFSVENSPLIFKSYLTLSTLKNNQPQYFHFQHDFFVSNVTKLNLDPKNIEEYKKYPGNVIILSKASGFGKTLAIVAVAGAVGGMAAVNNSIQNKAQK